MCRAACLARLPARQHVLAWPSHGACFHRHLPRKDTPTVLGRTARACRQDLRVCMCAPASLARCLSSYFNACGGRGRFCVHRQSFRGRAGRAASRSTAHALSWREGRAANLCAVHVLWPPMRPRRWSAAGGFAPRLRARPTHAESLSCVVYSLSIRAAACVCGRCFLFRKTFKGADLSAGLLPVYMTTLLRGRRAVEPALPTQWGPRPRCRATVTVCTLYVLLRRATARGRRLTSVCFCCPFLCTGAMNPQAPTPCLPPAGSLVTLGDCVLCVACLRACVACVAFPLQVRADSPRLHHQKAAADGMCVLCSCFACVSVCDARHLLHPSKAVATG